MLLFRPFGHLFRYIFWRGLSSSRVAAFVFATLGDAYMLAPSSFPPPFFLTRFSLFWPIFGSSIGLIYCLKTAAQAV